MRRWAGFVFLVSLRTLKNASGGKVSHLESGLPQRYNPYCSGQKKVLMTTKENKSVITCICGEAAFVLFVSFVVDIHSVIWFESTAHLSTVGGDECPFFLSGVGCFTPSIPGYPAWFKIRVLLYTQQTYADARARCSLFSHQWIPMPTLCRSPGNRHLLQTLRKYA